MDLFSISKNCNVTAGIFLKIGATLIIRILWRSMAVMGQAMESQDYPASGHGFSGFSVDDLDADHG